MLHEEAEELHAALSLTPSVELATTEPHTLARRAVSEATQLAPFVEGGQLMVPAVGALARIRTALTRTLSTSLTWARQHPMSAAATSVAFVALAFFLLSALLRLSGVTEQQQQPGSRLPHLVQVAAESRPGLPSVLTIANAQGDVLYIESFPPNTGIIAYEKPIDLNGDGDLEVVFVLGSRENPAITGRVYVYSFDKAFVTGQRDRPLMSPPFNTYHQLPYSHFPTPWSGSSVVDKLIVDDLLQNGEQKIVLIWRDVLYAGSALTVLKLPGRIEDGLVREAEYIHPGHIRHLEIVPIGDQKKILIAGVNNALRGTQLPFGQPDLYYSFIALLDPHQIWGEAPPYLQNEQGKGSQDWYGYFTPTQYRLRWPRLVTTNPDQRPEILAELAYLSSGLPPMRDQPYTTVYLDALGQFIREEIGDFPPPKNVTYHLYDSRQVWWLGQDEYERRYEQARKQITR